MASLKERTEAFEFAHKLTTLAGECISFNYKNFDYSNDVFELVDKLLYTSDKILLDLKMKNDEPYNGEI